jgi:surface antigen
LLKKILKFISITLLLLVVIYFLFLQKRYPLYAITNSFTIGDSVDSFNSVIVYNNGIDYPESHGKNYSKDSSYYYGKKWQCVEYIKRYYSDYLHHKMPNGLGNAKDFFNSKLKHGELNKERDLLQFKNDSTDCPKVNDIFVFGGKYGHVAIVMNVTKVEIEVIQQNIYMTPREKFKLTLKDGIYTVGEKRKPNGWLRMK